MVTLRDLLNFVITDQIKIKRKALLNQTTRLTMSAALFLSLSGYSVAKPDSTNPVAPGSITQDQKVIKDNPDAITSQPTAPQTTDKKNEETTGSQKKKPLTVKNYHSFAYVEDNDLDVGYRGTDGNWCAPLIELVFVTSRPLVFQDEAFLNQQISTLLRKLKSSCSDLIEAKLTGYSRNDQKQQVFTGSSVAKDDWAYSKLQLPNSVAPQASTPPQTLQQTQQVTATPVSPSRSQAPSRQAPQNSTANETNRPLTAAEISELQQRLAFLKFYNGPVNGLADRLTSTAVSNFLARNQINLPLQANLNVLNAVRRATGQNEQSLQALNPADIEQRSRVSANPTQQLPVNIQNYANIENPQQLNLSRRFSYLLVSLNNSLVNDSNVVLAWMIEEAKDRNSPNRTKAVGMLAAHRSGSQFEQEDVLRQFRNLILQEATSRRFELLSSLRLVSYFNASFGKNSFVTGKGFAVSLAKNRNASVNFAVSNRYNKASESSLVFRLPRFGFGNNAKSISIKINTPKTSDIVAILDQNNARLFSNFLIDRSKTFRTRLFFDLDISKNLSNQPQNKFQTVFEATERQYDLAMNDRNNVSGGDQIVYQWRLKPKQRSVNEVVQNITSPGNNSEGLSAQYFGRFNNIPLIKGHLVYRDGNPRVGGRPNDFSINRKPNRSGNPPESYNNGWALFKSLSALRRNPSLANNPYHAIEIAKRFLTDTQKAQLTGGKDFFKDGAFSFQQKKYIGRQSEFELNAFFSSIQKSGVGQLYQKFLPALPLPVVRIFEMDVLEYDFEQQKFPLRYAKSSRVQSSNHKLRPSFHMRELSNFSIKRFPEALFLPPDRAKFLTQKFRKDISTRYKPGHFFDERKLYLAIYADIIPSGEQSTEPEKQYRVDAKRASVYLDKNLTQEVANFSLQDLSQPLVKSEAAAQIAAYDPGNILTAISQPPTKGKVPFLTALRMINDQSLIESIVLKSHEYKAANELDQQKVGQKLYAQLLNEIPPPPPYWAAGSIRLGKYDTATQQFSIEEISAPLFAKAREDLGRKIDDFPFEFFLDTQAINAGKIKTVQVNEELARKIFEWTPNKDERKYFYKARVIPTYTELSDRKSGQNLTSLSLLLHIETLYIYHNTKARDNALEPIAVISLGPVNTTLKNAPSSSISEFESPSGGRLDLTTPLAYQLALAGENDNLPDETIDWLIANQWLTDNNYVQPGHRKFFNDNTPIKLKTQLAALRAPYRNALRSLKSEFPVKARIPLSMALNLVNPSTTGSRDPRVGVSRLFQCSISRYGQERLPSGIDYNLYPPSNYYSLHQDELKLRKNKQNNYAVITDVPITLGQPVSCSHPAAYDFSRKLLRTENRLNRNKYPSVQVTLDMLPVAPTVDIGRDSSLGNFAFVNVIIDSVKSFSDTTSLPHLVLKARFESIEYQNVTVNEKLSLNFTPKLKVMREEFLKPQENVVNRLSEYDIVGIKTGMQMSDAEAVLEKHFDDMDVFESVVDFSPAMPAFFQTKLFVRKDRQEFIKLYYEASDKNQIVRGISRLLAAAKGSSFSSTDVLRAGKRKYGETTHSHLTQGLSTVAWGDGAELQWCQITIRGSFPNSWKLQDGSIKELRSLLSGKGNVAPSLHNYIYSNIDLKNYRALTQGKQRIAEFERPYRPCQTTVQLTWSKDFINTDLVDWPVYIKAYRATLDNIQKKINSGTVEENAGSNVKL